MSRVLHDNVLLRLTLDRMTRILGCILAFAVFIWRYVNVPQNWEYVGSWSSIATIFLTLLPEFIHPFVYLRVYKNDKTKTA